MHAARLRESDRLRRVHALLRDGRERSTRDIVEQGRVVAVNSVVAELRENGCDIQCRRDGGVWLYRMVADQGDEFDSPEAVVGVRKTLTNGLNERWALVQRGKGGLMQGRSCATKAEAQSVARDLNRRWGAA